MKKTLMLISLTLLLSFSGFSRVENSGRGNRPMRVMILDSADELVKDTALISELGSLKRRDWYVNYVPLADGRLMIVIYYD